MKTILVIDDDAWVRESIQDLLETNGFQSIVATSGGAGLEVATRMHPDLILCDVQMPDMDGYAVLSALRQNPVIQAIPFIFLTGRSEHLDLRQGMNLGADDFLAKPCSPDELLAALHSRLERQDIARSQTQQKLDSLRQSIALSLPHEFRTPLTGIFTSVELLRLVVDDVDNAAEILEIADTIQTSAQRLNRLIQNFLLYSKLELATHQPDYAEQLVMASREATLEPQIILSHAAMEVAGRVGRAADVQVVADEVAIVCSYFDLEKIITELMDNACKFSPPGTPIQLMATEEDGSYHITLTNQGRGMTAEQIENLGGYMQFDRPMYEQQGVGLGLAIARRLVERYGGQLQIHSTPNQNTTVDIILPIASEPLADEG